MGYQLVSAPAVEPLDVTTAKNHLRVDVTDDDILIGLLIVAARQYAEQITGRSFISQQWKFVADRFPGGQSWQSEPFGEDFSLPANAFLLEKGPVQSIDSIKYIDTGSIQQTVAPSVYVADFSGTLARVAPRFGQIWPVPLPQIGSVEVTFTAGYGLAAAVPQGVKQWLLLRIGVLYENREEVVIGRSVTVTPLPFVDGLLNPYRIVRA